MDWRGALSLKSSATMTAQTSLYALHFQFSRGLIQRADLVVYSRKRLPSSTKVSLVHLNGHGLAAYKRDMSIIVKLNGR